MHIFVGVELRHYDIKNENNWKERNWYRIRIHKSVYRYR